MMKRSDCVPSSIYHLQLHPVHCRLKEAISLIPYFHELGIEGVCCSPIFESAASGYHITNPNRLNPALGTPREFEEFTTLLQKYKMKHILDVVPNHMGIKEISNLWWLDVLEKGPSSKFSKVFDINWQPDNPELQGKVLLPILGTPYEQALRSGDLKVVRSNGFWVRYHDDLLPLSPSSCVSLLKTHSLAALNKDPTSLHALLQQQYYRLSFYKDAGEQINYRRFFNIQELIAIHIERKDVLELHHRWVFELLRQNRVQGLRVDHPDGLYDPEKYFERILKRRPKLVFAEKILSRGELLPKNWKIDGTVGYDYLNLLSGLFVKTGNKQAMTRIYHRFIGEKVQFRAILYDRRKSYIQLNMGSEIRYLLSLLKGPNKKQAGLDLALIEVLSCFPVYRSYVRPGEKLRAEDRNAIGIAIEQAMQNQPEINASLFHYLHSELLMKGSSPGFALRFQQCTGPLMAKGLEDSTFYIYNRLLSLNEVGGAPDHFGTTKKEFHAHNRRQLKTYPFSLLASSTHDTKFSEDARLRIHAISERPEKWQHLVSLLQKNNRRYKTGGFPEANMEYFLYQMLIAIWPASKARIWSTLNKAIRENGLFTSWRDINPEYEAAVKRFLLHALRSLPPDFFSFQKEISQAAMNSSLSALVLKIGSCGIVNIYQGNERMNYCLVDPDNRRPIRFPSCKSALKRRSRGSKIWATRIALRFRREHRELFLKGEYLPLPSPDSTIAFMRSYQNKRVVVLAKRYFATKERRTTIRLPKRCKSLVWRDLFTGETFSGTSLSIKQLFKQDPFAILTNLQ